MEHVIARSTASHDPRARPHSGVGGVVMGGDYQGLGIARSLGRLGVPVIVIDDERSIAGASRYVRQTVRVPDLRSEEATVAELHSLVEHHGAQGWVLFPTRDEQVATLAKRLVQLEAWFRVPSPGWGSIRHAWDKRATYELASSLGIPIPMSWFPDCVEELPDVTRATPLIVKPAVKEHFFYATGVKAWRVDDAAALRSRFLEAQALVQGGGVIVQELIRGSGTSQYSYCAFWKDGQPIAEMTARRLRQHPSDFGRASTYVETVECPPIVELSRRFLGAIDYYGLVEIEYKRDPDEHTYRLLDVNARTWGYHSLGHAAGVDFAAMLFLDQLGASVPSVVATPGRRWVRLATDLPNAVVDLRAGHLAPGAYLRSLAAVDTEAVFSWRDPAPWLAEVALLPYLAVKRGL